MGDRFVQGTRRLAHSRRYFLHPSGHLLRLPRGVDEVSKQLRNTVEATDRLTRNPGQLLA